MLGYKRSARVGELIQQEISKIVQELKEPGLGFVTITGVKLTDDLQEARIFYSVIGEPEVVKDTGTILKQQVPEMRHQLARRLNLRRTPTIEFEYDTTPERASRIFTILEKIHAEERLAHKGRVEERQPEPAPKPKRGTKTSTKKSK